MVGNRRRKIWGDGIADKVRREQAAAKSRKLAIGIPLSATLPRRLTLDPALAMLRTPRSVCAEMHRRLRASVTREDGPSQVIGVTSVDYGEGKTAAATNLALAFAESGEERVILVDADMRRPAIQRWISPEPHLGLSHVLSGAADFEHVVHHLTNTSLRIVPAGTTPLDPLRLLDSDPGLGLLANLRVRFDRVIINLPPALRFPDAATIGKTSDGVLVVTRDGTKRQAYLDAISELQGVRILGAVHITDEDHLADAGRSDDDSGSGKSGRSAAVHGHDFIMFDDGKKASEYKYRWLGVKRMLARLLHRVLHPRTAAPAPRVDRAEGPKHAVEIDTAEPRGTPGDGFWMSDAPAVHRVRPRRPGLTPSGPRDPYGNRNHAVGLRRNEAARRAGRRDRALRNRALGRQLAFRNGTAVAVFFVLLICLGIWSHRTDESRSERPQPTTFRVTPTPEPERTPEPGAAQVRLDETGEVMEVRGPDPRSVLLGFCNSHGAGECQPVELAWSDPPHAQLCFGIYRDFLDLRAIEIRRDPRTSQWIAGNGQAPIVDFLAQVRRMGPRRIPVRPSG